MCCNSYQFKKWLFMSQLGFEKSEWIHHNTKWIFFKKQTSPSVDYLQEAYLERFLDKRYSTFSFTNFQKHSLWSYFLSSPTFRPINEAALEMAWGGMMGRVRFPLPFLVTLPEHNRAGRFRHVRNVRRRSKVVLTIIYSLVKETWNLGMRKCRCATLMWRQITQE